MPITDNDLRALMSDRSEGAPQDAAAYRVAAVQGRVRAIRRRRVAAGAALAVVLLAGIAIVPGLETQRRAAPVASYDQKVAEGLLTKYEKGAEAKEYVVFDTDEARVKSIRITPRDWNFGIGVGCDTPLPETYVVTYEIDEKVFGYSGCEGRGADVLMPFPGRERETMEGQYGVRLGKPVTITARVVAKDPGKGPSDLIGAENERLKPTYTGPMSTHRIALGVYTTMPREDFPLPPRPSQIDSLEEAGAADKDKMIATLSSRDVGANGSGVLAVTLSDDGAQVELNAVTPGTVTLTVNGVKIIDWSNWTWERDSVAFPLTPRDLAVFGLRVKSGDELTLGFRGSHFPEPGWMVEVFKGVTPS